MLNIIIIVSLIASVNVKLVQSKALQNLQYEFDSKADELLNKDLDKILRRSLDNLGKSNRALGSGPLDPLGNGNIPKWSKKNSFTRDYKRKHKRSLDSFGNGKSLKRALPSGLLDPLGNGDISKWSKKNTHTRDNKRSLPNIQFFRIVG